jgi:hypothetical protein
MVSRLPDYNLRMRKVTAAGVEDTSTKGRKALVHQPVLNYNKYLLN